MTQSKKIIRFASVAISLSLLAVLYFFIDWRALLQAWRGVDLIWLAAAWGFVFLLVALTVVRLRWLSPSPLSFKLGVYVNFQASALNLLAPSKLGDIGKAVFLARHTRLPAQGWVVLCLFEKVLDLTALLAWCAVGLLLFPGLEDSFRLLGMVVAGVASFFFLCLLSPHVPEVLVRMVRPLLPLFIVNILDKILLEWKEVQRLLYQDYWKVPVVVLMSFLLWAGHFVQIYLLGLAAGVSFSAGALFGLVPLAILIGLLPLTFAGMGTRDAAFVVLLGPLVSAPVAAVVGMLTTFRFILPAVLGIPLIGRDISSKL